LGLGAMTTVFISLESWTWSLWLTTATSRLLELILWFMLMTIVADASWLMTLMRSRILLIIHSLGLLYMRLWNVTWMIINDCLIWITLIYIGALYIWLLNCLNLNILTCSLVIYNLNRTLRKLLLLNFRLSTYYLNGSCIKYLIFERSCLNGIYFNYLRHLLWLLLLNYLQYLTMLIDILSRCFRGILLLLSALSWCSLC